MKKLPLLTAVLAVLLMGGEAFAYIPAQNPSTAQILVLISDTASKQRAYADTTTHAKATGVTTARQEVGSLSVDTNANIHGSLTVHGRTSDSISVLDSALTGYASKPTDTLRCAVDQFNVSFYFVAGITGTSNDTVFTVGHVPALCRPSHTLTLPAMVTNGNIQRVSKVVLSTAGVLTVYAADVDGVLSATGFSASNTKALVLTASFPRF